MSVGEFVGGLLHAVTVAHIFHLKEKSYARHMALGDFYDALGDKVDDLAECYQGCYGLIDDWPTSLEVPDGDPLEWLRGLSREMDTGRKSLGEDTELQNLADEIQALIDRAVYKVSFLG